MSKTKNKKTTVHRYKSDTSNTAKTAIIMVVCILLLLGVFYFITTKILDNAKKEKEEIEDMYL